MPHILSPMITEEFEAMWFEGPPYLKTNIYNIQPGKIPPVNYDTHIIKSHSLTHAEAELHVTSNGKNIYDYFSSPNFFFGSCIVLKLKGNNYSLIDPNKNIYHWEVSKIELIENLNRAFPKKEGFSKILLSTEFYPTNKSCFHDPNFVLTLSQEAAEYLISMPNFNLYGTSWKSSDYMPGSNERPIHKTLFKKAIIFELLDLKEVLEGEYFL